MYSLCKSLGEVTCLNPKLNYSIKTRIDICIICGPRLFIFDGTIFRTFISRRPVDRYFASTRLIFVDRFYVMARFHFDKKQKLDELFISLVRPTRAHHFTHRSGRSRIHSATLQGQLKPWYRIASCFSSISESIQPAINCDNQSNNQSVSERQQGKTRKKVTSVKYIPMYI